MQKPHDAFSEGPSASDLAIHYLNTKSIPQDRVHSSSVSDPLHTWATQEGLPWKPQHVRRSRAEKHRWNSEWKTPIIKSVRPENAIVPVKRYEQGQPDYTWRTSCLDLTHIHSLSSIALYLRCFFHLSAADVSGFYSSIGSVAASARFVRIYCIFFSEFILKWDFFSWGRLWM